MPQRLHSQIDTHNAHQAHFHSEKLSEHTTILTDTKNKLQDLKTQNDTFSGHANNNIGMGSTKLQVFPYAHNTTSDHMQPLKVNANGALECSVNELEVTLADVNLNVDTLEAKTQAITDKLDTFAGAGNNNIGEGSSKLQTYLYGRDVSGGVFRPLVCDGDAHLQVDCLSSALPTGGATEAKQDTAIGHLATVAGAVSGSEMQVDVLTMPTVAVTLAGGATSALQTTLLNGQTQDGAGGGNKLGVMVDAINTNTITGNGKIDTTNSRLGTINTSLTDIDTTLGTINNQFRGQSQDGNGGGNKLGVMVDAINTNTITQNSKIDDTNTKLDTLETTLTTIEGTVGFNKVNVNISSDASGIATQSTLAAAEAHLGNIDTSVDVLEACVGSNKVNVNIASNAVDFATQTTLAAAEAHLGNIDTATAASATDLAAIEVLITATNSKIDTLDAQIDLLEGNNTIKDVEWLSAETITNQSLSSVLDTEGYKQVYVYGESTSAISSSNDLRIFGSNSSSGTYYQVGRLNIYSESETGRIFFRDEEPTGSMGLPRYLKVFNSSGSSKTIAKLRAVMSDKRRYL